jgi:hypothetical protein
LKQNIIICDSFKTKQKLMTGQSSRSTEVKSKKRLTEIKKATILYIFIKTIRTTKYLCEHRCSL